MKKFLFLILFLFVYSLCFSDVELPNIFNDNMVLQRDIPVKIWGKSNPNSKIEISFAGKVSSVTADKNGKWSVFLDPLATNPKGCDFVVFENSKEQKRFKNVLVGEVWILSGQSNMRLTVKFTADLKKAESVEKYPLLRYAEIRGQSDIPQTNVKTSWIGVNSSNVANVSAVGFYFAERLAADLNVPVGLIQTAEGSSQMCAWLPRADFDGIKYLEFSLNEWLNDMKNYDFVAEHNKWKLLRDEYKKAKAEGKKVTRLPPEPTKLSKSRYVMKTPTLLYNARIAPLLGITARGVLWYQGESDTDRKNGCVRDFGATFERMVNVWRRDFKNDKLWFLCVQLTSFGWTDSDWVTARLHQFQSAKNLKYCGIVNTIDLGELKEIHPPRKTEIGDRLEKMALNLVYGKHNIDISYPTFSKVSYSNDEAVVEMNLVGKLVGHGEPNGFEVKVDGKWKPANAELLKNSNSVKVTSKIAGEKVSGVRYLWKNWVGKDIWLYSNKGLPAFPFSDEIK